MAALHEALKTLGPIDHAETPTNDLKPFLSNAFTNGQLIVDSVPIPPPPTTALDTRPRSSSTASSSSDIAPSNARTPPPASHVEALQKEWKPVKLAANANPLGMNVYKLGGKDGKGAWFARRSVHEGLGFSKWKKALEREFPETMKVQGGPGEGNIRGIGGEKRVEFQHVEGLGKLEVFLLSAQFPGPTTPRDFVTMFLTSDQALSKTDDGEDPPRHFMVISRPCKHPGTPERDGYIRGQYESVEFIREIPIKKAPKKSASTNNLAAEGNGHSRNRSSSSISKEAILRNAKKNHPDEEPADSDLDKSESGRARGHTISFDKSRGSDAKGERVDVQLEDDESEQNPIEWIMITRSDPGGSVPRFMIERGTPGGIVSDASKFLDWACAKDMDELESDDEASGEPGENGEKVEHKSHHEHNHEKDLHNWQTNGHLAGIEEVRTPTAEKEQPIPNDPILAAQQRVGSSEEEPQNTSNGSGLYAMVTGAAGVASGYIASHAPQVISSHLPLYGTQEQPSEVVQPQSVREQTPDKVSVSTRRESVSSIGSASSVATFSSALERYETVKVDNDASSQMTDAEIKLASAQDKELQKLAEKKRKLDEKLKTTREKELAKKQEDSAKEEEAIRKAEEAHQKEVKKQEEKYKKEVEKLEQKKAKEARKAEEKRRKAEEKDERTKLLRELEEVKADNEVLRKEKEILRGQVGDLQAENTALAAKVGKLGAQGEQVLNEVRLEVGKGGRMRASSLKGLARVPSVRTPGSSGSDEKGGSKLSSSEF